MRDYIMVDRLGRIDTVKPTPTPQSRCAGCGTPMGRAGLCRGCKAIQTEPLRTILRGRLENERRQHEQ